MLGHHNLMKKKAAAAGGGDWFTEVIGSLEPDSLIFTRNYNTHTSDGLIVGPIGAAQTTPPAIHYNSYSQDVKASQIVDGGPAGKYCQFRYTLNGIRPINCELIKPNTNRTLNMAIGMWLKQIPSESSGDKNSTATTSVYSQYNSAMLSTQYYHMTICRGFSDDVDWPNKYYMAGYGQLASDAYFENDTVAGSIDGWNRILMIQGGVTSLGYCAWFVNGVQMPSPKNRFQFYALMGVGCGVGSNTTQANFYSGATGDVIGLEFWDTSAFLTAGNTDPSYQAFADADFNRFL